MSNPSEDDYDDYDDTWASDPVTEDQPPYFPVADPDAPDRPDWDGVEPEGEQMPEVNPE